MASLLKVDPKTLHTFAYQRPPHTNYKLRPFKKRNGSIRTLAVPHATLKMIQRRIAAELATLYRPSSRAFAYITGRDIRGNGATHLGRRLIFSVDFLNFFDQINFGRIRGRLMAPPYSLSDAVATTIARLTVHDNMLPFGAPSSPILSNMICSALDAELAALGRETGSFYTRYADDIVFSTQRGRFARQITNLVEVNGVELALPGKELEAIILKHGFQINPSKTRLKSRYDSQIVCGVQINEKLNVRRALRREIRAMLHAWRKFGTAKVQEHWVGKFGNRPDKYFEPSLRGKIEFMLHIRGENDEVMFATVEQFNELTTGPKITYQRPSDWKAALATQVCIINAESSDMTKPDAASRQGTGFVVEQGLVLTNAHVVCDDAGVPLENIEMVFSDLKMGGIAAQVIDFTKAGDLALLRAVDNSTFTPLLLPRVMPLKLNAYPETGETLTLTGYPNFQDGDSLHIDAARVTGRSIVYGIPVFRISANVIYGNSGGPVLNDRGEVVGVAVCGSGINDAPYTVHNGAIPMREGRKFIEVALASATSLPGTAAASTTTAPHSLPASTP